MSSSVISDIQSINPSSIIELFTLTTTSALHGSATTYRFHAGSSLNSNGEIVWAGNTYQRFPVQAEGFAYQKGQIPRPTLTVSNVLGTITSILLSVNQTTTGNDLTGATVTRIRTLAKFIDAVNFAGNVSITLPAARKYVCDQWSKRVNFANRATINATFREVFEP